MTTSSLDPRIKLRHIVCFLEVARLKSVVRAAELLHMSQPAASKTLHELEVILDVRLFDRSKRGMFLTPAGELFQRSTEASVTSLRQGMELIGTTQSEALVRIGALPTVSAGILPEAMRRFTASGHKVRTQIVTGPNAYLLSLLRTGQVDLVIGRMAEPEAISGLSFEHFYSEKVVFAVRPDHPLLAASPFLLPMIEPFHVLMPPQDAVIRPTVERLLKAHGVSALRAEIETVSDSFGRSFIRRSDAIWIISHGVVAEDVADGLLALLPVDTAETLGPVGLTTRTDTAPSGAAQLLMQTIRDVARGHAY